MPTDGDYGYSAETYWKNEDFRGLIRMLLGITKAAWKVNKQRPYQYFDLNAGPGIYRPNGGMVPLWPDDMPPVAEIHGSPIIFLQEATKAASHYRAHLFERDLRHAASLTEATNSYHNVVLYGDNGGATEYLDELPPACYGLVYSDESGHVPPFDLLAELSKHPRTRIIDVLIYYSAATHKRARCAGCVKGKESLVDSLKRINKAVWIVRKPRNKHQWTFLLGTNWGDFPQWKKRGFYSVESPEGAEILERLNYSADERAEMRLAEALPVLF